MHHGLHHGQWGLWCHIENALSGVWVLIPKPSPNPPPAPPKQSTPYSFLHMCVLHMTKKWTSWVISKAGLSSEESREAGPLLILRMFWYFGLDLRWRIQASGKYQTDGEILALLLQSITWARLRASLKALNAFHPVAMPLFPGTGLSVKPVSPRGKGSKVEVPTVRIWALNVKHCLNRIRSKPFTRSTLVTTLRNFADRQPSFRDHIRLKCRFVRL